MVETSIVIRSFNEAEHIGDVLEAVDEQQYQDFEIILVDSGSTDGTLEIADPYVDKVEFVAPQNFTFGYSCNVGCEAASGDYVSFLSAHAVPTDPNWLGSMVENFDDPDVAMTYSNQVGAAETKFSEKRLFNELFSNDRKRQTPPDYFANNASSVIRKDLWEDHPFDEYLTGHEDIEWAKHFMDNGYVVIYEPTSCIYHIHDETWEQVFHRFEREAVADVEIGVKNPSDRWGEYLRIPTDIATDIIAGLRNGVLDIKTVPEIVRFRYNQHMGTASGLQSDLDLESNRYEYFYAGANEKVVIDSDGNATLKRSPLPEVKPNEVLIRTDYIGVSPDDRETQEYDSDQYPIVPGESYVGTVAKLGANANSVEVGDTVVGETEFPCGLCGPCGNKYFARCEDSIQLGVDTDEGPYSRFLTVPSDYVYPLRSDMDPKLGVLAGRLARISAGIERAERLAPEGALCAIVGDTHRAKLSEAIAENRSLSVTRIDTVNHQSRPANVDLESFDIVVEATGDREEMRTSLEQATSNSIVVLLAEDYGELTISDHIFSGKTIIHSPKVQTENIQRSIGMLSEIDSQGLIGDEYTLDQYESAWTVTKSDDTVPIIAVDG